MTYAKIVNGKVENIIVASPGFVEERAETYIEVDDLSVNLGDTYLNGVFIPVEAIIEQEISTIEQRLERMEDTLDIILLKQEVII